MLCRKGRLMPPVTRVFIGQNDNSFAQHQPFFSTSLTPVTHLGCLTCFKDSVQGGPNFMSSSTTLLQLQQRHKPGCLTRRRQCPASRATAYSPDQLQLYAHGAQYYCHQLYQDSKMSTLAGNSMSTHTNADKEVMQRRSAHCKCVVVAAPAI